MTDKKTDRYDYWVSQPGDFIITKSNNPPIVVHVVAKPGHEKFIETALDAFVEQRYLEDVDTSEGPKGEKAWSFELHDTKLLRRIASLVKGKATVTVDRE